MSFDPFKKHFKKDFENIGICIYLYFNFALSFLRFLWSIFQVATTNITNIYLNVFLIFQYHGKLVKLWDKYNCSSKDKAKQGCPKSQSFYAATPHHSGLAGNLNNLVHVSHNPETNLTTTNVASPQTPKTHTLSTESSRVSGRFMYVPKLQIIILLQAF